jgi:hypothetical protein
MDTEHFTERLPRKKPASAVVRSTKTVVGNWMPATILGWYVVDCSAKIVVDKGVAGHLPR